MRRLLVFLLVLGAIAGASVGTWLWARPAPPRVAVRVAERTSIADTVSGVATGYVEPARRVAVQAETAGRIVRIDVRRGDHVQAGDPLLVLDSRDLEDQIRALQASIPVLVARVSQAGVRNEQLTREEARLEQLFRTGALPGQQRDNATYGRQLAGLDRQAAVAGLVQARVNLETERSALRKSIVRAPFDGVVLDVHAEVGEMAGGLSLGGSSAGGGLGASAGGGASAASGTSALLSAAGGGSSTGLVDVADDSDLFVYVDVDEMDFGRVAVGQQALMTMEALGKRRVPGTVVEVFPYISRALDQNRTARVKIRVPPEARADLRPGMSANVEIVVASRSDVLAVPTPCVLTRATGKAVWRLDGDKVHEVPVRLGVTTWEVSAIDSGLSAGDRVVIPPGDVRLAEGMRVEPDDGQAP